jgi:hypothetical protein
MLPPITAAENDRAGTPRIIRIPNPVAVRDLAAAMNSNSTT